MRRPVLGIAVPVLTLWCALAVSQEIGSAASPASSAIVREPSTAATTVGPIERAAADLRLMDDKTGNLVPVPGFTLEEFDELVRQRKGLQAAEAAPQFTISSLSLQGTAIEDYVELTARLSITTNDDLGVRVPLRLNQAILRSPPIYEGPGRPLVYYDEGGDGYVILIRGGAGDKAHQLTLQLLAPVSRIGDESRLKLMVARATTSGLELSVPAAGAAARVSPGAVVESTAAGGDKGTQFSVRGLAGDFEIAWSESGDRRIEAQPLLEAKGGIVATMEDRTVQTAARLTVRGYGGPFDHFRVRLPANAELVPESSVGYRVVPVPTKDDSPDHRPLVEIRLEEKQAGPVEIRLTTRQTNTGSSGAPWSELGGFEVLEASQGRQWGYIGVVTSDDWYILWGPSRGVRQIDEPPDELSGQEDLAAVFEYVSQPCSLSARAIVKASRINVEQDYRVYVEENQVRLEGELKYSVRGREVYDFSVDLPGWNIDQVGPDNVVAAEGVAMDAESGTLTIPLSQPVTGEIAISIQAHRKLEPKTSALDLAVPYPREASSVNPAGVLVVPDDNVVLSPDLSKTVGLVSEPVPPQMVLPERQQTILFYRGDGSGKGVLAAGVRFHEQSIAVGLASKVSLAESGQSARVNQTLAYTIGYRPADSLTVEVPRALSQDAQFLLDGEPVAPVDLPDGDTRDADGPVRKRIMLPRAKIGDCKLQIDYQVAMPAMLPKTSIFLSVPLAVPAEGELTRNTLVVSATPGINVQPREGPWTISEAEQDPAQADGAWSLTTKERAGQVVLGLRLEDRDETGSTLVQRAWIQTWLTRKTRQDRAVFRFVSDRDQIDLILPEGTDLDRATVMLDGAEVQPKRAADGAVELPLPRDARGTPHWIEARYRSAFSRQADPGRLSLEFPRLGRDVWVRRLYWQLVLPPNEHVIADPGALTPEFQWSWKGLFWQRAPVMNQKTLETWAGTESLEPIPAEANCYLYSSLGPVERCELRAANRTWIVLVASGLALAAGLLWIRVSAARHPGLLFAGAVALVGMAVIYPAPALLFSQSAAVGLGLALLAGLLHRGLARRSYRAFHREVASSVRGPGSSGPRYRPAIAGRPASTEASPASVPVATTSDSPS